MEVLDAIASNKPNPLPFPKNVPTAPLLRISLSKLSNHDEEESKRFFEACKDLGFFYLDLGGTLEGQSILKDANNLFDVGE